MIRELDPTTLTFSMWQQSRQELRDAEEELLRARHSQCRLTGPEIDELEARLAVLRVRTERLLGQALDALREYAQAGNTGV